VSFLTETKFSFSEQYKDEQVVLLLRRHWFVILIPIIGYILLAFIPVLIRGLWGDIIISNGFGSLFWFGAAIFYLIWWMSFGYRIMLYLLDVWIVTDHRIIDSRQLGFFKRIVAEAKIDKVQDVTTRITGFFATILKFGDVEIQTAGTERNFLFEQVPDPTAIREKILKAISHYRRFHPQGWENDL